jgi:hypothetical protein
LPFVCEGMGLNPFKGRRDQADQELAQLRWLSTLAREDLVELGERLEDEAPPTEPAAVAEREQARTLTAEARPRLREAETADAVLAVQATIGRAFVHLARSDAIVRGEEPPTGTDPCEFNPQHGPAVTETTWTPISGEATTYKCCRSDADLIAAGKAPRFRKIKVGDRTFAWHDVRAGVTVDDRRRDADSAASPYAQVATSLAGARAAEAFSHRL